MIKVLQELKKFSDDILSLNAPVAVEDIRILEEKFNLKLPVDYKEIMKVHNGFSLLGNEVFGVFNEEIASSLGGAYVYEHSHSLSQMPEYLVPFSPDGAGDFYCFDVRVHRNKSCPVLFWQNGYEYTPHDQPEKTNETFTEWLKEVLIEWTLNDYNYDGTPKF